MNKKASAGPTAVWIPAFLMIFFLSLMYVSLVAVYFTEIKLTSSSGAIPVISEGNKLMGQEKISAFFKSDIDYDSRSISMLDYLALAVSKKDERMMRNVKERFEKEIGISSECYILRAGYGESFLEVYKEGDGRWKSLAHRKTKLDESGNWFFFDKENKLLKIGVFIGEC